MRSGDWRGTGNGKVKRVDVSTDGGRQLARPRHCTNRYCRKALNKIHAALAMGWPARAAGNRGRSTKTGLRANRPLRSYETQRGNQFRSITNNSIQTWQIKPDGEAYLMFSSREHSMLLGFGLILGLTLGPDPNRRHLRRRSRGPGHLGYGSKGPRPNRSPDGISNVARETNGVGPACRQRQPLHGARRSMPSSVPPAMEPFGEGEGRFPKTGRRQGERLSGGTPPSRRFGSYWPFCRPTLWDYINRAMPMAPTPHNIVSR